MLDVTYRGCGRTFLACLASALLLLAVLVESVPVLLLGIAVVALMLGTTRPGD